MKARLAKKLLKRMAVTSLKQGDVVVVSVPAEADVDHVRSIRKTLEPYFPSNRVLVKTDDVKLDIVRQSDV